MPTILNNLIQNGVLADTHAHLHDPVYSGKERLVLERAAYCEVSEIWLMSVDIDSALKNMRLVSNYQPRFPFLKLRLAIGIDPDVLIPSSSNFTFDFYNKTSEELGLFVKMKLTSLLEKAESLGVKVELVGEIGIDNYWLSKQVTDGELSAADAGQSLKLQKAMFIAQVEWAWERNLPVSIHSRSSEQEVLDILKDLLKNYPEGEAILHSFTGKPSQFNEAQQMGVFVGINAILTYDTAELLRATVERLAKKNISKGLAGLYSSGILLETDAPYLIPKGADRKALELVYGEQVNEPAMVYVLRDFVFNLLGKEPS